MCADGYNQIWKGTYCDTDNIQENYECHRPVGHDSSKCWDSDCCAVSANQTCVGAFKAVDTDDSCGGSSTYYECLYDVNNTHMDLNYKGCSGLDVSQDAISSGDYDLNGLLLSNGKDGPKLDDLVVDMFGAAPHYHQMYEEACVAWQKDNGKRKRPVCCVFTVDAYNAQVVHNGAVFDTGRTFYTPEKKLSPYSGYDRYVNFHSIVVNHKGVIVDSAKPMASSFPEATKTFMKDGGKVLYAYMREVYKLL